MPYLILNPDNSIADVAEDAGDVQVTKEQLSEVVANKFGHYCFDYNGGIVLNQTRLDSMLLDVEKREYIDALISKEVELVAKERLAVIITNIKAVSNKTALEAMKRG